MYVTNEKIAEIADNMQPYFELSLHSESSLREISAVAAEELANNGLPTRKSLCIVVAKVALNTWIERIMQRKAAWIEDEYQRECLNTTPTTRGEKQ